MDSAPEEDQERGCLLNGDGDHSEADFDDGEHSAIAMGRNGTRPRSAVKIQRRWTPVDSALAYSRWLIFILGVMVVTAVFGLGFLAGQNRGLGAADQACDSRKTDRLQAQIRVHSPVLSGGDAGIAAEVMHESMKDANMTVSLSPSAETSVSTIQVQNPDDGSAETSMAAVQLQDQEDGGHLASDATTPSLTPATDEHDNNLPCTCIGSLLQTTDIRSSWLHCCSHSRSPAFSSGSMETDPTDLFLDGIGEGRADVELASGAGELLDVAADAQAQLAEQLALNREKSLPHDWLRAPPPSFLSASELKCLGSKAIQMDHYPDSVRVHAFLPHSSPSRYCASSWRSTMANDWLEQRRLYASATSPTTQPHELWSNNRDNWVEIMPKSVSPPETEPSDEPFPESSTRQTGAGTAVVHWDQYQPFVFHLLEHVPSSSPSGFAPRCRGSSGFEYVFECVSAGADSYTNATIPKDDGSAEVDFQSYPLSYDHGTGLYTVRASMDYAGTCLLRVYEHTIVDRDGNPRVVAPNLPRPRGGNNPDRFDGWFLQIIVHIKPMSDIVHHLPKLAQVIDDQHFSSAVAHQLLWGSVQAVESIGPLLAMIDSGEAAYLLQAQLSLRLRRRGECTLRDYASMHAWSGAWYRVRDAAARANPCPRREQRWRWEQERAWTEAERMDEEAHQLTYLTTDRYLGPLCTSDHHADFNDSSRWRWPGYRSGTGNAYWIFVREECYFHKYSPRALWRQWADQRLLLLMDSNGPDNIRNIVDELFGYDQIEEHLPRDFSQTISLGDTVLSSEVRKRLEAELCSDSAVAAGLTTCGLGIANQFPQVTNYANHMGMAVFEHSDYQRRLRDVILKQNSSQLKAVLLNAGLHDRDLALRGRLNPLRQGLRRRPNWCVRGSMNYTFHLEPFDYALGDPNKFNGDELNEREVEEVPVPSDKMQYVHSYEGGLSRPQRAFICDDLTPSRCLAHAGACGKPESHAEWRMRIAMKTISEKVNERNSECLPSELKQTHERVKRELLRRMKLKADYRPTKGSVAEEIQRSLLSDSHPAPAPEFSLLPASPARLFRSGVMPAGASRADQMNPYTTGTVIQELRSTIEQHNLKGRARWEDLAGVREGRMPTHQRAFQVSLAPDEGAAAPRAASSSAAADQSHRLTTQQSASSSTSSSSLPLCLDVMNAASSQWLSIDVATMTAPVHFGFTHSDGGHYGVAPCGSTTRKHEACIPENYVDVWAGVATMHALTLFNEWHLSLAFRATHDFTTKNCRVS